MSTTTSADGFAIVTDTNFTYPNESKHHTPAPQVIILTVLVDNIFTGMGAKNPNDDSDILPTATFVAHPGETYTIWPKVVFYVSTGEFDPGAIIDVQSVGQTLEIDFEEGLPDRTYIHTENGTFVPE